jgi:hypothetical protein
MNCDKCQELISDLLDGSLNRQDELNLNKHLEECLQCAEVRTDLESIVGFCRAHQGEYPPVPNERALWLGILNVIEGEGAQAFLTAPPVDMQRKSLFGNWLSRSWELSLPQLAASLAAIIMVVSLTTIVALRRSESGAGVSPATVLVPATIEASTTNSRMWQQQQAISYWNQRVEVNKMRWSQDMRDTFDRNLKVIDQAVNDSIGELNKNPHDEVSEEMLNAALNEKLTLLKEFADL